jgi:hypothetical protein
MLRRFLVISAAIATSLCAQPSTENRAGVMAGQVLNSKTGEPVRRASISVRPSSPPGGGSGAIMSTIPPAPYAATTDAEGKFRIEKVDPGTYRISVERQGFVRQEYNAAGRSGAFTIGTPVQLAAGQELKNLEIKMTPQAVITGRVLDEEGEAVARVQIQALRRRTLQGKSQLLPLGGASTNDVGEYRLADLPPGRYWVSAVYQSRMRMMNEPPARNTADKPQEDYIATFYPNAVDETAARPVDVEAGQQLPGIDIRLQKAPVFRISGKVNSIGGAAQRARILVMPRDGNVMSRMVLTAMGVITKEDGTFEIAGVPAGSYFVGAMGMQSGMTILAKAPVDVTRENVSGVTLDMGRLVTLTGKIHLPGGAQQADGKPLSPSNVRIQLNVVEGMGFGNPPVAIKADGTFSIENVGPEKYRIGVFNLPQGTWLKSIRAGGHEILDTDLDLSGGSAVALDVTLAVGAGQVGGIVQDSSQKPVPGALVILTPDPPRPTRTDLQRLIPADQHGKFVMENVAPGSYKVFALIQAEALDVMDPDLLKAYDSKARRITLRDNGQEQLTLTAVTPEETPK